MNTSKISTNNLDLHDQKIDELNKLLNEILIINTNCISDNISLIYKEHLSELSKEIVNLRHCLIEWCINNERY